MAGRAPDTTTGSRPAPKHGERACYLRGCQRPECVTAHTRYMKHYRLDRARTGTRRTDSTPAAQHVRQLAAGGWSHRQIAAAARCSRRVISSLISNPYPTIETTLATRILAARPTLDIAPPKTYVDATGTVRRFQALTALGHSLVTIAAAVGMSPQALSRAVNSDHAQVTAACARSMAAAYLRLAGVPGHNTRARRRAAREGWPSPIAWGDNIDDPAARSELDDGTGLELGRSELAALRRREIRHLASYGVPEQEIAVRLGMEPRYVHDLLIEMRAAQRAAA